MKSTRKDNKWAKEYPKLMINKGGVIVLFTRERVGMVVSTPDICEIGIYSITWRVAGWEDYDGSVTLENF